MTIQIRDYLTSDLTKIVELFHDSVHAIPSSIYSAKEKEAWAPTPPDNEAWRLRLAKKRPFVAVIDFEIVGFIELEGDGHIDCLYVHKDYQRRGIASELLKYVRRIAQENETKVLYVEASKIAFPFFQRNGFVLKAENSISLRGQSLVNYLMALEL